MTTLVPFAILNLILEDLVLPVELTHTQKCVCVSVSVCVCVCVSVSVSVSASASAIPGNADINLVTSCTTFLTSPQSTEHAKHIKENIDTWFCEKCNFSLFLYNHVENKVDFIYCMEDLQTTAKCYFHTCLTNCSRLLNRTTENTHFLVTRTLTWISKMFWINILHNAITTLSMVCLDVWSRIWVSLKPACNYQTMNLRLSASLKLCSVIVLVKFLVWLAVLKNTELGWGSCGIIYQTQLNLFWKKSSCIICRGYWISLHWNWQLRISCIPTVILS